MSEWQTIETAPKDGTDIRLKGTHPVFPDWELVETWWDGDRWNGLGDGHVPTHWKPVDPA